MVRQKKNVVVSPDEAGAQTALKDFALANSQLKEMEAKIEQDVQKIRSKYKGRINDMQQLRDESYDLVHAYASENKEQLFVKKRSIDWNFGTFGFRLGTPKVEKKRGITWDAALQLIKGQELDFVRTKQEVDRDKIIASREDPTIMGQLAKLGLSVGQTETFFVEPKEEDLINA